jgi:hypothetical protein
MSQKCFEPNQRPIHVGLLVEEVGQTVIYLHVFRYLCAIIFLPVLLKRMSLLNHKSIEM